MLDRRLWLRGQFVRASDGQTENKFREQSVGTSVYDKDSTDDTTTA